VSLNRLGPADDVLAFGRMIYFLKKVHGLEVRVLKLIANRVDRTRRKLDFKQDFEPLGVIVRRKSAASKRPNSFALRLRLSCERSRSTGAI